MPSSLQDLTPYLAGGWQSVDKPGYYIHRGYVYLDGAVFSNAGDPPVTQDIFAGLPAAIRPAAPVALTLATDIPNVSDTKDLALVLPLVYEATVYPDGSLRLNNPLDGQLNIAPSAASYYYVGADGVTKFPRYTSPMTTQIALGARWPLHPVTDSFSGTSLAPYLGEFDDIDAAYAPHGERVHLSGRVRARVDGAQTLLRSIPPDASAGVSPTWDDTPVAAGEPFDLVVNPAGAFVSTDEPIKPLAETPPLAWCCPPFQQQNHDQFGFRGAPFGQNFVGSISGTLGGRLPGTYGFTDHVDHGTYLCGGAECRTPGGLPAYAFDVAALVNICDPLPPWFMLQLFYGTILRAPANDGCSGGDCGPIVPVGLSLAVSGSAGLHIVELDGTTPAVVDDGGVQGYLAPDSPLYIGDPFLPDRGGIGVPPTDVSGIIWKREQLTSLTVTPSGIVNVADPLAFLTIYPLYERRQAGLRSGDILDLTGAGWPGVPGVGGLAHGAAFAAQGQVGVRRRHRITGKQLLDGAEATGVPLPGAGAPVSSTNGLSGAGRADAGRGAGGIVRG